MTATATEIADILAAWRLIEKCELMLWFHHVAWACESTSLEYAGDRQYGPNPIAAVKAWAEAAGVTWEPPQVVGMWALVQDAGALLAYRSRVAADIESETVGGRVVPCVVVVNREGE